MTETCDIHEKCAKMFYMRNYCNYTEVSMEHMPSFLSCRVQPPKREDVKYSTSLSEVVIFMSKEELLTKMYEDIKAIKEELDEIKIALIPEDKPTEEELREIELGTKEIAEGKYRAWKEIKEEL
ncbi:MAG: hypothetical protein AYK18_10205 [Theionarchaea archaeon DG-70]|nr:MAG: hypothetical protein AYK18_10205 [Theionarchaea archaeon DG-70]